MKYLLIVLVVIALIWLARAGRRSGGRGKPSVEPKEPGQSRPPATEEIVACAHCGVHLPKGEAFPGRGGLFCGEAHRLIHERANSQ